MYWRLRYVGRSIRLRMARLAARRPAAILVRGLVPLYLALGLAAGGYIWARENPERLEALWAVGRRTAVEWAGESAAFITDRLSGELDAESGIRLLESVLPARSGHSTVLEPSEAWRTPMRAWVHIVTGYDFSEPRSFLEAAVPGFLEAEQRVLDRVAVGPTDQDASGTVDRSRSGADVDSSAQSGGGLVAQRPDPTGAREERFENEGEPSDAAEDPRTNDAARGDGGLGVAGGEPTEAVDEGATDQESTGEQESERSAVAERAPVSGPDGVPAALAPVASRVWGDEPLVLIFHTHTSESYQTDPPHPQATATNHLFNSSDTGITRVGEALARKLREEYNIATIHTRRIHDWPQHVMAYRNARETVEELLQRYPTIQVVLDLHRQGIKDFTYATTVGEVEAVSVELIYTTAQSLPYAEHPNWRANQSFATVLSRAMEEIHPGLLRRVMRVDDSRYNQDLHPRMLLLEVGNYLDEEDRAIASAKLLADPLARALAEVIDQGPVNQTLRRSANGSSRVGSQASETTTVVPPPPPRPSPGRASRG